MAQWRTKVFDPVIVLGQILSTVSLFYVFIGILVAFISFLTGAPPQLASILNARELQPESFVSWLLFFAFLLASLLKYFLSFCCSLLSYAFDVFYSYFLLLVLPVCISWSSGPSSALILPAPFTSFTSASAGSSMGSPPRLCGGLLTSPR